jgi:bacillithiol system protein YtxJ
MTKMNWNELIDERGLENIIAESNERPVLIFKHSTRCSISSMAINRLERAWSNEGAIKPYYLDLIKFRDISSLIANKFGITHQSPQVILVKNGKAVYDNSHMGISYNDIIEKSSV